VVNFPLKVLVKIIGSMRLVAELPQTTETELFQRYLEQEWAASTPARGQMLFAGGKVALMRLAMHMQAPGTQRALVDAFEALSVEDQVMLSDEMARTGIAGQQYKGYPKRDGGPAFLVYYAPAFLRQSTNLAASLSVLSEVYRAARQLWPLSTVEQGTVVIIRIEALKEADAGNIVEAYANGGCYVLVRKSSVDAVVETFKMSELATAMSAGALTVGAFQVLPPPKQGEKWKIETIQISPMSLPMPSQVSGPPLASTLPHCSVRHASLCSQKRRSEAARRNSKVRNVLRMFSCSRSRASTGSEAFPAPDTVEV